MREVSNAIIRLFASPFVSFSPQQHIGTVDVAVNDGETTNKPSQKSQLTLDLSLMLVIMLDGEPSYLPNKLMPVLHYEKVLLAPIDNINNLTKLFPVHLSVLVSLLFKR